MTSLANSFEGGTNGTTITAGNSGGTSGNAFDTTSTGAGATTAFDNTHAAHGSLSCEIATTSSATSNVQWAASMGTQAQVWFRLYLYFTANPAAAIRVFSVNNGTVAAFLRITTTGQLVMVNGNGTVAITTSTATIPLNQWFRVEGFVLASLSVGQTELKLYSTADSVTPTETDTSAANNNLGVSTLTNYLFGITSATPSVVAYWQDNLGLSSTGYLGPALHAVPLAAVPASHPALVRGTAKIAPAIPALHGAMARVTAKKVPGTSHPAAAAVKGARKNLAATPHAAGKTARTAAKALAAAVHPAAAARKTAGVTRRAAVTAAGKVHAATAALIIKLGIPVFRWITGTISRG
jgi:hypothetical protein